MIKFILLFIINFALLPIYFALYLFCFFITLVPIFPVVTARNNITDRLKVHGIKNRYLISLVLMNYIFYFLEIFFFEPFGLIYCSLDKNTNLVELMKNAKNTFPQSADKGFIFILGHTANVESLSNPVIAANRVLNQQKIFALAKPARIPFFNKILAWYRERPGMGVLWTDTYLFSNMKKALDKGCSICMLVDQKPPKNGAFIKFFGKFAAFPTAGLRFCLDRKNIVLYCFGKRIMPGWTELTIQCGKNVHLIPNEQLGLNEDKLFAAEVFLNDGSQDKNKVVSMELAYFVKQLENFINRYPSQWCWDYKKWSRNISQ